MIFTIVKGTLNLLNSTCNAIYILHVVLCVPLCVCVCVSAKLKCAHFRCFFCLFNWNWNALTLYLPPHLHDTNTNTNTYARIHLHKPFTWLKSSKWDEIVVAVLYLFLLNYLEKRFDISTITVMNATISRNSLAVMEKKLKEINRLQAIVCRIRYIQSINSNEVIGMNCDRQNSELHWSN